MCSQGSGWKKAFSIFHMGYCEGFMELVNGVCQQKISWFQMFSVTQKLKSLKVKLKKYNEDVFMISNLKLNRLIIIWG